MRAIFDLPQVSGRAGIPAARCGPSLLCTVWKSRAQSHHSAEPEHMSRVVGTEEVSPSTSGQGEQLPALPSHTTGQAGPHPAVRRVTPLPHCTEAGGSKNAPPMVVSPLVEFHCRLHPLPTRSSSARRLIGWRIATHETRFPTTPSHRSGLRPSRNYYALC